MSFFAISFLFFRFPLLILIIFSFFLLLNNVMRLAFSDDNRIADNHGIANNSTLCFLFSFRKFDAFVDECITIQHEISKRRECDLNIIGSPFVESSYGIALPNNYSLTSKIPQTLIHYKEYGIENEQRNNSFRGYCQSMKEPDVSQMSIQSMSGLFFAVRIGVVVALIDFFLRNCFYQFLNWKRYNISS